MTRPGLAITQRAAASLGASSVALHARAREILERRAAGGHIVDVGCGRGELHRVLAGLATAYTGIDAVRYDEFPRDLPFHAADLDRDALPVPAGFADVVVAIEVIEHLENPRRFAREIVRVARPGATILISTPNQLSALSLLTLLARGQFNAFQDGSYPAHLTALLPIDLRRIAAECRLENVELCFSLSGRVPFAAGRFPRWASRLFPRLLSDNVFIVGRVPA